MTNPVPGYEITYPWGVKNDRYASGYHTGDDYFSPDGTDIVAARGGVVEVVGYSSLWGSAYGQVVVVRVSMNTNSADDVKCLYAHTSHQFVKAGDHVQAGQRIAAVGSSGTNTTGPHLHYEERTYPWSYNNQDRKPQFQDWEEPVTRQEMQDIVDLLLNTKLFGADASNDLKDITVRQALRRTYLGHDGPGEV